MNKTDLLALYLCGTYCHKTGTRPASCVTPRQPTTSMSPDSHMKKSFFEPIFFLNQSCLFQGVPLISEGYCSVHNLVMGSQQRIKGRKEFRNQNYCFWHQG